MTKEREVNEWYKDYEQVSQQWQEWLNINFDRYPNAESAWRAFKRQQGNSKSIRSIKKDLR